VVIEQVKGPHDVEGLPELLEACRKADHHAPLGEHSLLAAVRPGIAGHTGFTACRDGDLLGYTHISELNAGEGWSVEVAVRPAERGKGVGTQLFSAAVDYACAREGGPINLWVYGDSAPARALARRFGFHPARELLQLRLDELPSEAPPVPDGVTVSTFRPDDAAEWLQVNNRAFAWHPENGGWTMSDLEARMETEWFDLDGFLIARDASTGHMVGFCWTKLHEGGEVGEIYVIAVDPDRHKAGVGLFLTVAGLTSLRSKGARSGMLYVDADNAPAIGLYRKLGFVHHHTDTCWRRDSCP